MERDDRETGQVATAVVVLVSVLLLAFAMTVGIRLSKATDEAGELQRSADAAALAGAQAVLHEAPGQIVSAIKNGREIPCGLGQEKASQFADRNGANLVSYCYYPANDEVHVTVRSHDRLESGEHEERQAVAQLGVALGPCEPLEPPTPSPSSSTSRPSPTKPSPSKRSPSPTKEPPEEDEVACGDLDIPVIWPGDDGDIKIDAGDIALGDHEPSLVD